MDNQDVQLIFGKRQTWNALKILLLCSQAAVTILVRIVSGGVKNLIQTHKTHSEKDGGVIQEELGST